MGSRLSRCAGLALVAICGIAPLGCEKRDAPAREAPPNPPAPSTNTDTKAAAEGKTAANPAAAPIAKDQLLAWLDPDAVAVAYVNVPQRLRGDTVAVVYGLPPLAEDLLTEVTDLARALEAVRPSDAPATDTWLGTEGLVTQGRSAQHPTVLHPVRVPHDEAVARIEALGLTRSDDDAFEVWIPQRVFPYKVVLLDGDVAAFIHATELGGLLPLAAARDMPPSDAETQLSALLGTPSPPALALFAVGPMMHLVLLDDVLQAEFVLQYDGQGALGTMILQIDGDAAAAVETLEARKAPEQSDQIQQLMDRTAYSVERGAVMGRLQLSAADAALLHARSADP